MLLVYPGQRAHPAPLRAVLEAAHNEARKARLDDIAARTKAGIPLDDETAWPVVDGVVGAIADAKAKQDSAALARLAGDLARATTGNAIVDPGEFVAPEGHRRRHHHVCGHQPGGTAGSDGDAHGWLVFAG